MKRIDFRSRIPAHKVEQYPKMADHTVAVWLEVATSSLEREPSTCAGVADRISIQTKLARRVLYNMERDGYVRVTASGNKRKTGPKAFFWVTTGCKVPPGCDGAVKSLTDAELFGFKRREPEFRDYEPMPATKAVVCRPGQEDWKERPSRQGDWLVYRDGRREKVA
ncbi:hypothetical protein M8A51_23485 [Schlegelella sp. S2-27]|uniref:Helix-turn-helix domain-containing protein n=1 Tax=Caldimonas mangrovi TaxID=2944811 RepID=A0ABT0YXD6_9BURK|nr:hypothetical protein [Caldimonas mangrovi]MCM5682503.1 hypothetical protein [Caldimonas mangrovi]